MSARREKRLRKLEARVAYMDARIRAMEVKQIEAEEMHFGVAIAPQDHPQPAPRRRSLWRRLLEGVVMQWPKP